jgi:hypothetical protein
MSDQRQDDEEQSNAGTEAERERDDLPTKDQRTAYGVEDEELA